MGDDIGRPRSRRTLPPATRTSMIEPNDSPSTLRAGRTLPAVLIRKWAWFCLVALLVGGAGVLLSWRLPVVYQAEARLLIEPTQALPGALGEGTGAVGSARTDPDTHLSIVRGAGFRRRVAQAAGPRRSGAPPALQFDLQGSRSILRIRAEGTDPREATRWANLAARTYAEQAQADGRRAARQVRRYLVKEAYKAEVALRRAEAAVQVASRNTHLSLDPARREQQIRQEMDLAREQAGLRAELAAARGEVEHLTLALRRTPREHVVTEELPNPEYTALEGELATVKTEYVQQKGILAPENEKLRVYEDRIGEVEAALAKAHRWIVVKRKRPNEAFLTTARKLEEAQTLQADAEIRLRVVEEAHSGKAGPTALVSQETDLEHLQRTRDAATGQFATVTAQLQKLTLLDNQRVAPVRVLDVASVPTAPARPDRQAGVAVSLALALLCGLVAALVADGWDDRVYGRRDLDGFVPLLGSVPTLPLGGGRLLSDPDAGLGLATAFRGVRAALGEGCPHVLTVTSSLPHEGKSVASANYALALAQQGKRVILVDLDLAQPSLDALFGLQALPGLTNVLRDGVPLETALREARSENLQVLCVGEMMDNPGELLGDIRFQHVLEELRGMADVVVLDTPPVLTSDEARFLAGCADGSLLVVEAGRTRRRQVRRACELLELGGGNIVGMVLNRDCTVTPERSARLPKPRRAGTMRPGLAAHRSARIHVELGSEASGGNRQRVLPPGAASAPVTAPLPSETVARAPGTSVPSGDTENTAPGKPQPAIRLRPGSVAETIRPVPEIPTAMMVPMPALETEPSLMAPDRMGVVRRRPRPTRHDWKPPEMAAAAENPAGHANPHTHAPQIGVSR